MPVTPRTIPELMAPAGDWQCARAAVENGADAFYFGLQNGFNARARAANFTVEQLPEFMAYLRSRGAKGYLTLNTLVFNDELDAVEQAARQVIEAGVDAVLVQDLGLLRLLHRLCPELPLHASTQMTLSSVECIREVERLGIRRVVLPRELSIEQIAAIGRQTSVELEVFVHGALCISYSGQCYASLTMGGRSANRGRCAQPCRLPYQIVENEADIASEKKFPLSPYDLAAYDRLTPLLLAGVAALKIEGRLKPPEYVAGVTRFYRAALDEAWRGYGEKTPVQAGESPAAKEMEQMFSRGFCHGWLDGPNHAALVSGRGSANRGTPLGRVQGGRGERIFVELTADVYRGDGVVFEADRSQSQEQGGRVYEIFIDGRPVANASAGSRVELAFRHDSIDTSALYRGQNVWKTDDPRAEKRLQKTFAEGCIGRRVPIDLSVEAAVGAALRLGVTAATGAAFQLESSQPLPEATKHPLTVETLREQFGRLGNTPYELRRLDASLDGRAMIPLSELGKLRRLMVERLESAAATPASRAMLDTSAVASLRKDDRSAGESAAPQSPTVHVLCRSLDQLEAALDAGARSVIAEFGELSRAGDAVRVARQAGASILLATPRIHEPGENADLVGLIEKKPNGLLVRNLAGLAFCRAKGVPAVADFSFNAVNDLTVRWLLAQGANRVTPAYDLNEERLVELASSVPTDRLEVVVHRHTPMFHTKYCLFCATFSKGTSRADCGQPCRNREIRLRDRLGVEHRVTADARCRNTVFHAEPQSCEAAIRSLAACGVRHFRVELMADEGVEVVRRMLTLATDH